MKTLERFKSTADAVHKLLYPYAEVVIHCIETNKVYAIFNPFSKRKAGDESLLSRDELSSLSNSLADSLAESMGPYKKTNWDGRELKSISNVIKDEAGKEVGLLCINFDISGLVGLNEKLMEFISPKTLIEQPEPLFKDDWQERVNVCVHQYLLENSLALNSLTRNEKKNMIIHLKNAGAFSGKNAAQYIANVLNISRATVYKYLSDNTTGDSK